MLMLVYVFIRKIRRKTINYVEILMVTSRISIAQLKKASECQ